MSDNLLGIPETRLAPDPAAEKLDAGVDPVQVAATHPTSSLAWAVLSEDALADGDRDVEAYAYARTGYHRGLDALRKNGWKGFGPVPWSHEGNRGVLRCFYYLAQAAQQIGETEEYQRLSTLLDDSDPAAAEALR